MPKDHDYLGDGAYVEYRNGQYELFTDNGITKTNQVFLEPEHIERLYRFYIVNEERRRGK